MLLEVQRINVKGRRLQTLRIKRLQKIDEFWFAKQIELYHHRNGERSIIYINETSPVEKTGNPAFFTTLLSPLLLRDPLSTEPAFLILLFR